MKKIILVTGASGFVGINFCATSMYKDSLKTVSVRKESVSTLCLDNVSTILHLAGKAHEMKKIDDAIYWTANRDLTYELARRAKNCGVRHFIFLSSIKVYGTDAGVEPLTELSVCRPTDIYGKSKFEGEQKILSLQDSSFTISIIRPPLIYGPGVKGNVIKLLRLANSDAPLPFANIDNKRSMVYIGNLNALIDKLIQTPVNGHFIAGDECPLSTSQFVALMRYFLGKSTNLFQLPILVLKCLNLISPALVTRLYGSLIFDNSFTNRTLNFKPPFSAEEGIKNMIEWYKSQIKQ